MVAPRREGRAAPDPDSWQAHFEALQAGGLRQLDTQRAMRHIVLPVLVNIATVLAAPYVATRGLLPLLPGVPVRVLVLANLYGHTACVGVLAAAWGARQLAVAAARLHNSIRDDRYLVGRELHNFEAERAAEAAASAAAVAVEG
jgi:E3 ubiquitin-protein ligase MARCH6